MWVGKTNKLCHECISSLMKFLYGDTVSGSLILLLNRSINQYRCKFSVKLSDCTFYWHPWQYIPIRSIYSWGINFYELKGKFWGENLNRFNRKARKVVFDFSAYCSLSPWRGWSLFPDGYLGVDCHKLRAFTFGIRIRILFLVNRELPGSDEIAEDL